LAASARTTIRDGGDRRIAMDARQIDDVAQRLYRAHGDRAEYEAAQKAKRCEDVGADDDAASWRSVRARIRILRGANES
jgi:hypothetical protein